jgi:hypothetical protein
LSFFGFWIEINGLKPKVDRFFVGSREFFNVAELVIDGNFEVL